MRRLDKDLKERFTNLTPTQKEFIITALKSIQGSKRLLYFAAARGTGKTYMLQTLDALMSTGLRIDELLNSMGVPQEQESTPRPIQTILSRDEYARMKYLEHKEKTEFMSDGQRHDLFALRKMHFSSCREMCIDPDTGACIHGNLDPCKAQSCPNQEPIRELTEEELGL